MTSGSLTLHFTFLANNPNWLESLGIKQKVEKLGFVHKSSKGKKQNTNFFPHFRKNFAVELEKNTLAIIPPQHQALYNHGIFAFRRNLES